MSGQRGQRGRGSVFQSWHHGCGSYDRKLKKFPCHLTTAADCPKATQKWTAAASFTDENGKRRFVRGTGASQTEALSRQSKNMQRRFASDTARTPTSPMLSTYIDEWLAESSEQSPKTKHRNRRNLEQWVLPYMDKPLLTITTEDCHRLFKVRLPEVGATKSSIHNAFATLRNLMNHARMMDKLPQTHDPLARVKVSKPPSKVKPDDEKYVGKRVNVTLGMLRWLEDPSNPHHHLYTRTLLMFSGLRRAELLGLEWSCIHHLEKRGKAYIEVKQQLAGPETKKPWHIHPRTKTGNVRRTDLSETMRKALLAHRELELHADADWAKDLVFVTQTKRGTRNVTFNEYSADWNTVLKGYMTKNGREFQESDYYRPHYARHVAVHLLVRGGTTLIVAQRMVGHGDVKMTEHYYQTSTNETRAGAAGLDAFMGLGKH